ncbi:MAG: glycosyltransferase family 2 protein [Candidatus Woesebacteria bacterium]|nr:glycosyltransferase family 2 protein [Candidatus Woesebacteria bacterium]
MKNKLSVVLATRNEEENIGRCLESVKSIADEIIIVDEYSKDKTREIAESFGAKVFLEPHHDIFHITKQIALEKASNEWILQMDADEALTPELSKEIKDVITGKITSKEPLELFARHQALIEERDGKIGKDKGEITGYFIPRRNMFLGKPLIHAGVYPDGVIRLVKNGFAKFPQKSVHEQIEINGKVGWLNNDLLHFDSPTLKKYFWRMNRYTDLHAKELKEKKVSRGLWGFIDYVFIKPTFTFLNLYFRHLGIIDGVNGFLWSFLSSLHFPIAYFKYITRDNDL